MFYKGSWVEDIEEPLHPESLRFDYSRARSGFLRTIAFVWGAGLAVTLVASIILVTIN
ncbi:MAG: hypothetical protein ACYC99_16130 [Candidatus Geothermincolia bacterium]